MDRNVATQIALLNILLIPQSLKVNLGYVVMFALH